MDDDESDSEPEKSKINPRQKANFFSILFFTYTLDIFRLGHKRELDEDDLYQVLDEDRSKMLGDKLEKEWNKQLGKKRPSLYKAIYKVFRGRYFLLCGALLLLQFLRLSQPVALYYAMLCYHPEEKDYTTKSAYIYMTWISISSILTVLLAHSYAMGLQHMGMKIRVACTALVYRKCLKLSTRASARSTIGQMVNMLSNDVTKFDYVTMHLPYVCVFPIEMPLLLYTIYVYVGYIPYSGCLVMLMLIPILIIFGISISLVRLKISVRTDERVRLMSEIISGIKVIKMYVWEIPFKEQLSRSRRSEMKQFLYMGFLKGTILSLAIFMSKFALFVSLTLYVYTGNVPMAQFVFTTVAFFNVFRQNLTIFVPYIISYVSETSISIRRLQRFLFMENYQIQSSFGKRESIGVTLEGISATWDADSDEKVIHGVTFTLESDEIIAVVGAVGSGKSSLLYTILGELTVTEGRMKVEGAVSYATQEPWLFSSNVRQNILFGEKFDYTRYNEVVEVCALKRDFSLFPFGDETFIGDRGITLSGGQKARISLARAVYRNADIYLLDDPLSAVDPQSGKHIFDECIMGYLSGKCRILVTHQMQHLKTLPRIIMLRDGVKYFEGNFTELTKVAGNFTKILESDIIDPVDSMKKTSMHAWNSRKSLMPPISRERKFAGGIRLKVYGAYLKAGGFFLAFLYMFLFIATQTLSCACDIFVMIWVKANDREGTSKETLRKDTITYSLLTTALAMVSLLRTMFFFNFCVMASTRLHEKLFEHVIKAPMSFFNSNPAGRILNRFSKDIGLIDDVLPIVTLDALQIGLYVLGVFVLAAMVNPIIIAPLAVMSVIFLLLKYYYLKTGRDVKRIEGIVRSPVFTHLGTTLQGIITVRAYGAGQLLTDQFERLQDVHSSSWHTFLSTSRAFGFALDLICSGFITSVCFSLVIFPEGKLPGDIGLIITQCLTLTGLLQWGIRQWSEMENHMTSVERVVEYTTIPNECLAEEPADILPTWPENGRIEFKHLYMRYYEQGPPVLKDLNFTVKSGEKVGIVGRTGAGKSSLIGSIFQLSTTYGKILIDGVDIRKIPLNILRNKIAIIPQEPMLFKATLRKNLDPFGDYSDADIWNALSEVRLKNTHELPDGLDTLVKDSGSNFSTGQKQLLCLARAILKRNNVLIMDEATANVDPYTDSLIQNTIREKFVNCTIITIAHRLDTVIDCDRVMVIDEGQCKEYDHPFLLLNNPESMFNEMVQFTGSAMAEVLTKLAKESYDRKMADSRDED